MRSALVSSMLIVSLAGCGASHVSEADGGGLDARTAEDSGAFECDAGPIDLCRAPVGASRCCGDSVPPLCAAGGGLTCPLDAIRTADCRGFLATGTCEGPIPPCTVASDCTLLPESCCGFCGVPTAEDMIAVPDDRVDEHVAMACAGGVGCPDCAGQPDPFLLAICEDSRCEALDLHTDERTLCEADADCQLAAATCCACGLLGPSEVVAYNPSRGSYADLVCDPRAECPPCVPMFDGLEPGCDAGRCVVRILMP